MDLTIYTYGHIDAMFYILNGIAMIMNSGFTTKMIQAVSIVATFYYGLKAAYSSSSGGAKQHLIKIAGMVLVINALLIPKTTMQIVDHVTKQRDMVGNIPYGFAIPVGFLEQFGDILTAAFEQGFTPVGNSNYRDYGMVFGARLVGEARNFKIKTPEFAYNMDQFIKRCVVMDAAMGNKYTINDLFESDDIWTLVSTNASPLRRVEMKVGRSNELKTCREAANNVIAPAFITELDKLISKYKKTDFSLAGSTSGLMTPRGTATARSFFKQNLGAAFSHYLGGAGTAESNLKQYMMMNSMSDHASSYGFARASMTQESNWRISGDLASMYLPMLLSIIKGIVYASFIFTVPLMLMGGGMGKYLSYITVVASLQLWPALNSILNMFIDLYSASQMQDLAGGAVSFTSYSRVGDYSDKIVAVASGLQMVIPYLAFNIIQGGVGGFIHLASSITGASTSAAGAAAQEVTTGNKSFDNYSAGNTQVAMQQGFKTDFNSSYKSGASETQLNDGTIVKRLPNGKIISMRGEGIDESSGLTKITHDTQENSQEQKSYNETLAHRKDLQMKRSEAQRTQDTQLKQYATAVAQHANANKGFKFDKLGTSAEGVHKAIEHAKNFGEGYDYTHGQNNVFQGSLSVDAGGSGNVGTGGGGGAGGVSPKLGANAGITVSAKGDFLSNSLNTQALSEHTNDSKSSGWNEDKSNLLQAASNEDFSKSAGVSQDLLDNISATNEKIHGFDQDISMALAEENQLATSISQHRSAGRTISTNTTSEVRQELINAGMHPLVADRVLSDPNSNPKAVQRAIDIVDARYNANQPLAHIPNTLANKGATLKQQATKEMNDFAKLSKEEVKTIWSMSNANINKVANADGMNAVVIKAYVAAAETDLSKKVEDQQKSIGEDTSTAKQLNTAQMEDKQAKVDAEDDNRFRWPWSEDPFWGKAKPKGD